MELVKIFTLGYKNVTCDMADGADKGDVVE